MPRTQANFVALAFAYLILFYICANLIGLERHVTSRGRMGRVEHSTRILRSPHPVELGNLLDPRVRIGRVNPIGLKPDPTITLIVLSMFLQYSLRSFVLFFCYLFISLR